MRKIKLHHVILVLVTIPLFSCQDKIEETYTVLEPNYLSYSNLREGFNVKSAEEIIQPGKIYFKDNYIFVNEYKEGIHVIDNSNPENPQKVSFLEIPGNVDMAINGATLYADSYVDLLAIDISDLNNILEISRVEGAFPYMLPEQEDGVIEASIDENQGVVTGWKRVEKTVEVKPVQHDYMYYEANSRSEPIFFASTTDKAMVNTTNGFGVGGSMARFTLYDQYLYAVDNAALRLFSINNPEQLSMVKEEYIGWNIETIFPYEGKLFIGAQTGMYIFSLEDPLNPKEISYFWHASSCDPVVVSGDYAYVTLRAGNLCGDNSSQLDVIDISDIKNPTLLKEYPMEEPYGLGIDDSVLFVCDGDAGLKIYNASDPNNISANMIKHYPDINAFDVIPLGEVLLMSSIDGLYQYDYSDLNDIHQLSYIPIAVLIE